ncbi:hypothetical protein KSD_03960 [Ktedonobacter sp. SOSP1-85]|uniref:ArsR/SmtB family transcription factor n=1 Tax=Ktedonobacter sp. SOSP1-85 TaxID=2778367 RepID=UPI001915F432|nr:helix-turn-helix transcriptional regulator [Ktedonobacter sp. SOSP1-85]GHO72625.1 hypothetical protein KSD_03960 [Ktedonobacter sp. SOSP1-85]
MASKRCLPTRFFEDPDVMSLSSKDAQLILIGLVLMADDEGRELAHASLISRKLDYTPDLVEQVLSELEANELIILYQVGRHRYYSLTRWKHWQSLSLAKITPSKHPAPPSEKGEKTVSLSSSDESEHSQGDGGISQGNSGKSGESPSQYNLSQYNLSQRKLSEEQDHKAQPLPPANVIPFPPSTDGDANEEQKGKDLEALTAQVATILQLPANAALSRLVYEFAHEPHLSLTGEADAAREWIDDRQRNRKGKRMSPAFFREWLKRECASIHKRRSSLSEHEATGTENRTPTSPPTSKSLAGKSLMHMEQQYQQFQAQRGPRKGG